MTAEGTCQWLHVLEGLCLPRRSLSKPLHGCSRRIMQALGFVGQSLCLTCAAICLLIAPRLISQRISEDSSALICMSWGRVGVRQQAYTHLTGSKRDKAG